MSEGESGVPDTPQEKCPPDPSALSHRFSSSLATKNEMINQDGGSLDCVRGDQCGISFDSDVRNSFGGQRDKLDKGQQVNVYNKSILKNSLSHNSSMHPPAYSTIFSSISSTQPIETSNAKPSALYDSSLFALSSWPQASSLPISVSSSSSSEEDYSTVVDSSVNSSTESLVLSLDSASFADSPINFTQRVQTFFSGIFANHISLSSKNSELFQDENWFGVVLDLNGEKTLIVKPKDIESLELRESVLELFDTADEEYECEKVIIALEKGYKDLAQVIHSLLYVGGQIIPPNATCLVPRADHVLVGLEI